MLRACFRRFRELLFIPAPLGVEPKHSELFTTLGGFVFQIPNRYHLL